MKLVTFLKDHAGYQKGASQYYAEPYADELITMGLVKDAHAPEVEMKIEPDKEEEQEKEQDKALDAPIKDKMLRMPKKKK